MKIEFERIAFPYDTIYALAAINDNTGICTIYENALCSAEQCEKSVRNLLDRIEAEYMQR